MPATLIIRADASAAIGTGHVMRCLASAEAWIAEGGRVVFVSLCDNESLAQRVVDTGADMVHLHAAPQSAEDIAQTQRLLDQHPQSALLLDGYGFDAEYQNVLRDAAHNVCAPLVVIDDFAHLPHYSADIIVNQNLGAEEFRYNCPSETRLLLGTDYVMLRSEYTRWREWRREIRPVATRILVTLGGSDPSNVTLKVARALNQLNRPELEVVIVVGAANPHRAEIETEIAGGPGGIHLRTDVRDMAELMAWADAAVSAGGTTCWELAFMGLPNVVIVLADNQRAIAHELDKAGVSILLGESDDVSTEDIARQLDSLMSDAEARKAMSARGRALVDGNGARRVLHAMRESIRARHDRD